MGRNEALLFRVVASIPNTNVADVEFNVRSIKESIDVAIDNKVDVVVFPELCITGYTCGDLFQNSTLINAAMRGLDDIRKTWRQTPLIAIVGLPRIAEDGRLMNSAAVINFEDGNVYFVDKRYLPGYKEFYEQRWFSSGDDKVTIFNVGGIKFGVELCEDVWSPCPPSTQLSQAGAEVIFNLSASNELIGKHEYLVNLLKQQSARCISGYVYSSSGYGESSQDLVYAGNGIILENGKILGKSERFSMESQFIYQDIDIESLRNERIINTTFSSYVKSCDRSKVSEVELIGSGVQDSSTYRTFNAYPFKTNDQTRCMEILQIQSHALAKRLEHTGLKPVIGISGGSDSTLALLVAIEATKKLGISARDIIGITMPGFATSERTLENSRKLMSVFGITQLEYSITDICKAELKTLGLSEDIQDVTFENIQARARTSILMNMANKMGGLVIGTGDLSELALGWCTYNADHMSMYGVNVSVPKTLVKSIIANYDTTGINGLKEILDDILDTPVSPELTGSGASGKEAQITEDKIGPYELHDFFLYNMLRHGFGPKKILYMAENSDLANKYSLDVLKKWLTVFITRFFSQQFKRSCLPDGPKIGSISLSPRGDWRMPSDACVNEWLDEIKKY